MLIFDKDGFRFRVQEDSKFDGFTVDVLVHDEREGRDRWYTMGIVETLPGAWDIIRDFLEADPE